MLLNTIKSARGSIGARIVGPQPSFQDDSVESTRMLIDGTIEVGQESEQHVLHWQ